MPKILVLSNPFRNFLSTVMTAKLNNYYYFNIISPAHGRKFSDSSIQVSYSMFWGSSYSIIIPNISEVLISLYLIFLAM